MSKPKRTTTAPDGDDVRSIRVARLAYAQDSVRDIRPPASRALIAWAREKYQTDDVEIDDDAVTSPTAPGDAGTWVSAWVWVEP